MAISNMWAVPFDKADGVTSWVVFADGYDQLYFIGEVEDEEAAKHLMLAIEQGANAANPNFNEKRKPSRAMLIEHS